jgi:hypothetical protein|tara:strand:+ start:7391 stop:9268 length:1878 start_codon:yes stop_codon:yes gene_type:complete
MANTKLTSLDFENIKAELKDYLKNNTDFTDYDFEGSALANIVDLLAYNTHYQSFVSNMIANESFLDSSILRDNVVLHAKSLGYLPRSAKSSSSLFNFNVFSTFSGLTGSAPGSITIKAGSVFNAIKDKVTYSLSTPSDIVTPLVYVNPQAPGQGATGTYNNVRLYEGTYLSTSWIVDQNNLDQRFIIPNTGLDLDTLIIKVQPDSGSTTSDLYTRGVNITQVTSTSKVYFVQEIEDEKYELVFGDGVVGAKLPNNSKITATYIISSGADANGIQGVSNFVFAGNITNNLSVTPGSQTVTISNSPVTEGGAKPETIDSIKFQAPRFYSAQNRAVTADDYETIVRLVYPNVDDIFAYGGEEASPPEYGKVKIVIKPKSGRTLSVSTKEFIKGKLRSYKVASLTTDIVDPHVLYPTINSVIYFNSETTTKSASEIKTLVESSIDLYEESTALSRFGGKLKYSKLIAVIDDADPSISRNSTTILMRRDIQAILNTKASYELCYVNSFAVDTDAPVLTSSGFKLEGYTQTFYLEDDYDGTYLDTARTTKNVKAYYLNNSIKTYLGDPIGSINYSKGEILLGMSTSIIITETVETGSVIKVTVRPEQNDIFAKREVYLSLTKGNIQVLAES